MGYSLAVYLFSSTACGIYVSTLFCTTSKAPTVITIIIASALHLSLCIERIFARYYSTKYEEHKMRMGTYLIVISTSYSFIIYGWLISSEDFTLMVPYCASGNAVTTLKLETFLVFSPSIDVASILIMFFLTRKERKIDKSYELSANFSASENRNAYLMLWPFSTLHLVAQISFLFLAAYGPSIFLSSASLIDIYMFSTFFYVTFYGAS
ncbi:unnamed protein product, partial [Mesorhabditis belari]|uniref:Uncharacterized protein n=1 Tax=Mesorhabditis belari TaxID=2138241 RepID=A0AAF3FAN7_9BILA